LDERRPYQSLAGSTALHGAVLALILLGFASAPRFADSPESIPVETITLSELNQVMNGEKKAEPAPQPPPTPPEPPPDLRATEEPAQTPQPKPEATPPPRPEPTPPPKAEATPPPRPEPASPPKLAADDAPVLPPQRPKVIDTPPERPKEPQPEKPKQTRNYDPNVIAKLIGQAKPSTPAVAPTLTASTTTASATPQGLPHHDAPHMSLSLASALDAWLTESYLNCWTPPPAMPEGDTYVAEIKVVFNADGSLSGRPVLLNPPTDPAWRAHAESAMRAVKKCDPLKVPAQYAPYFDQWKVETIHFDPRETQG
jgi:outer membrane biosynthesis protein TonB